MLFRASDWHPGWHVPSAPICFAIRDLFGSLSGIIDVAVSPAALTLTRFSKLGRGNFSLVSAYSGRVPGTGTFKPHMIGWADDFSSKTATILSACEPDYGPSSCSYRLPCFAGENHRPSKRTNRAAVVNLTGNFNNRVALRNAYAYLGHPDNARKVHRFVLL
jgi:hypothetical protein